LSPEGRCKLGAGVVRAGLLPAGLAPSKLDGRAELLIIFTAGVALRQFFD